MTHDTTTPDEWREIAIAEVKELEQLLTQPDFSPEDLRDRLAGLSQYLDLQLWITPENTCN